MESVAPFVLLAVSLAVSGSARSTAEGVLLSATGLFAGKLALGLGAQGGGLAVPGALGLLAERGVVGLGGGTGGANSMRFPEQCQGSR